MLFCFCTSANQRLNSTIQCVNCKWIIEKYSKISFQLRFVKPNKFNHSGQSQRAQTIQWTNQNLRQQEAMWFYRRARELNLRVKFSLQAQCWLRIKSVTSHIHSFRNTPSHLWITSWSASLSELAVGKTASHMYCKLIESFKNVSCWFDRHRCHRW